MSAEKRSYFESLIKNRINELIVASTAPIFPRDHFRDGFKDEADVASEIIRSEIELALSNSNRRQIFALQQALQRVKIGSFGICDECEEPISEKRLSARPETTLCIKCQEERDRSYHNRRGH